MTSPHPPILSHQPAFQLRGLVDVLGKKYSTAERVDLLHQLNDWNANLYIWCTLGWDKWADAYRPLEKETKQTLELLLQERAGVQFWVGLKPGDTRYCGSRRERKKIIANCTEFIRMGAQGIYLSMADLHRGLRVKVGDGLAHAELVHELVQEIGDQFKALVGEAYWGKEFYKSPYWDSLFQVLPHFVLVAWTGVKPTYNKKINFNDVPVLEWPLLIFDNYYASSRMPSQPYRGRDLSLSEKVTGLVLNPNDHYAEQLPFLKAALNYLAEPSKPLSNPPIKQEM